MEGASLHDESMKSLKYLYGLSDLTLLSHRHENVRIFLANQKGQKYVIKVLTKTSENVNEQNRIKNEARFTFDQMGLPKIIEFIDSTKHLILIRNHVSGVTLTEYWKKIKRKHRLQTLKRLVHELVSLFDNLKNAKVLHLDIKPSNLLVTESNDELKVYLIDFGLARFQEENSKNHTFFPLGYAAPEFILNQLDLLDHRTDLFSLGVCIWELFEGFIPLSHPNPLIMTNLQLNLPLPEGIYLPLSLQGLLQKMTNKYRFPKPPNQMDTFEVRLKLRKAMDQRYNNLSEFQRELNEITEKHHWLIKLFSKS